MVAELTWSAFVWGNESVLQMVNIVLYPVLHFITAVYLCLFSDSLCPYLSPCHGPYPYLDPCLGPCRDPCLHSPSLFLAPYLYLGLCPYLDHGFCLCLYLSLCLFPCPFLCLCESDLLQRNNISFAYMPRYMHCR